MATITVSLEEHLAWLQFIAAEYDVWDEPASEGWVNGRCGVCGESHDVCWGHEI